VKSVSIYYDRLSQYQLCFNTFSTIQLNDTRVSSIHRSCQSTHLDLDCWDLIQSIRGRPVSPWISTGQTGHWRIQTHNSPLPSLPYAPFPFPPRFSPLPSPSLPLEVGPLNLGGLGTHCKLPQRGLGWSRIGNQIWCFLALKSDI